MDNAILSDRWKKNKLGKLANLKYGKSPKQVKVEEATCFPIYGTSGHVGYSKSPLFSAPLVLIGRKGTIDNPIYIEKDCWIIDTAFGLNVKETNTDVKWLYYYLRNLKLERLNEATGVPSLSKSNLELVPINTPPRTEQRKIASILTSVDDAIEKTEAIIEQTEKVKKGLMQKLLIKGIGHTKFKQTEIGEIPEEWEVAELNEVCTKIKIGLVKTMTKNYSESGVPLIRNQNIKENEVKIDSLIYLNDKFAEDNNGKRLRSGDIVTVHTGDIGTSAVIEESLDGAHGFATLNTRVNSAILNPYYLCWFFNSGAFKKQAYAFSTGDGRNNLNLKDFVKSIIVYPKSLKEQKYIVRILESLSNRKKSEKQKLFQLQTIKKGLMQVLLTGKVRVKVDEQEAVPS